MILPPSSTRRARRELRDAYRFPGFTPSRTIVGIFGDPHARIITLTRRAKKQSAVLVAERTVRGTIGKSGASAISPVGTCAFTSSSICAASRAGGAVG
ncbi:MAG: hypothetical protein ACRDFW_12740 [bacterium]